MRTFATGLLLAALAGSVTYAADMPPPGPMGPMANMTVTRAEAQARAEAMFSRMDVNKDGKLDAADRTAARDKHFDQMDTNKDGKLSRDEFDKKPPMAGKRMGRHGGDHKPMAGAMTGPMAGTPPMGQPGPGQDDHMMMMADTNHDGAISKDEFVAARLKMFDMADANHDGKVTPEERQAAMAAMHEHMMGATPPAPPAK